jgi:cold shock protein
MFAQCHAVVGSIPDSRKGPQARYYLEGGAELMPTGRVKFFNEDRGYGFIVPDGGGSDVFVHVHEVEAAGMKRLVAGQLLTYDTAPARDGRTKAVTLRLANPER